MSTRFQRIFFLTLLALGLMAFIGIAFVPAAGRAAKPADTQEYGSK